MKRTFSFADTIVIELPDEHLEATITLKTQYNPSLLIYSSFIYVPVVGLSFVKSHENIGMHNIVSTCKTKLSGIVICHRAVHS